MEISWEEVREETKADMIGGQMHARIGGKRVYLGRLHQNQFYYTEIGEKISRGLYERKVKNAVRGRAKPTKNPVPETAATQPTEVDPNQLDLELGDDATVHELLE